jgi:alkyl sulfatase BDS1-like metallo-beta-lactamase superfamily hydrolase
MLPASPRGQIDAGLCKTTSRGNLGLIQPNDTVEKTGDTRTIDGIQFEFQMAPSTESPLRDADLHAAVQAAGHRRGHHPHHA